MDKKWQEIPMPGSARLDASGVLHHVIIRGIERRNISEGTHFVEHALSLYVKRRRDRVERIQDDSRRLARTMFVRSPSIPPMKQNFMGLRVQNSEPRDQIPLMQASKSPTGRALLRYLL